MGARWHGRRADGVIALFAQRYATTENFHPFFS
jgi:hypothetical protein